MYKYASVPICIHTCIYMYARSHILKHTYTQAVFCSVQPCVERRDAIPGRERLRHTIWCALQCVAVCCSVLQCVAVYCSVLQCLSVLQFTHTRSRAAVGCKLACVAECRSVLQCVAVCCSVLQCIALCCSVL